MTETIQPRAHAETHTLAGGYVSVRLYGSLDVHTMGGLWRELEERLQPVQVLALDVDATDLDVRGGGGLALLRYLKAGGFTPHAVVTLRGLNPELDEILHLYAGQNLEAHQPGQRRPPSVLQEIGTAARDFARDVREQIAFVGIMAGELVATLFHPERLRWMEVKRLCIAAGVNALPIVSLLSFLIGLILGFEGSKPLAQFGAQIFIADMVGFASVREMGPIMTAILLAGRSGAAFAAEIGSMKIDEELSALSTMGLNPMRFLALQRVAAGILLTPLLTVYTMFTGVLGGMFVMVSLGFSVPAIYHEMATRLQLEDIGIGLGKSVVFGVIFSAVGCLRGFQTGQGPIAVGVSATRAVVSSIFLIIFADTVFAGAAFFLS
jgi:phospholipid/cholesterol/gamma-HCH transport system permease protein